MKERLTLENCTEAMVKCPGCGKRQRYRRIPMAPASWLRVEEDEDGKTIPKCCKDWPPKNSRGKRAGAVPLENYDPVPPLEATWQV